MQEYKLWRYYHKIKEENMIDIAQAIQGLDAEAQFTVSGSPSNEAEYQAQVKYVTGADENGTAIFSDTQPWTWAQVSAKQAELQADYDAKEYQRQRAAEYPELGEQLDKLYHDINNGTLTTSGGFFTALNAVKTKYPKE